MLKWGSRRETESEQGVGGDDLTRNHVSYPWPESSACDRASRLAPTSVAKLGDDLWIGVKCQPNVEIAGSPRNALRCSHGGRVLEGERWMGSGPSAGYQPQPNFECHDSATRRRRRGLSLHVRREKDH